MRGYGAAGAHRSLEAVCTVLSSFSTVCQAVEAETVIGYGFLGLLVLLGGMVVLFRNRS